MSRWSCIENRPFSPLCKSCKGVIKASYSLLWLWEEFLKSVHVTCTYKAKHKSESVFCIDTYATVQYETLHKYEYVHIQIHNDIFEIEL